MLTLVCLNVLATLLVYVPLYENQEGYLRLSFSGLSLDNIYRYWDGPLYLVVAKTFYNVGSPGDSCLRRLGARLLCRPLSRLSGNHSGFLLFVRIPEWHDSGHHRSHQPFFVGRVPVTQGSRVKTEGILAGLSVYLLAAPVADLSQCRRCGTPLYFRDAGLHSVFPKTAVLAGWSRRSRRSTNPQSRNTFAGRIPATCSLAVLPGRPQTGVVIPGWSAVIADGALRGGPVVAVRVISNAIWRFLCVLSLRDNLHLPALPSLPFGLRCWVTIGPRPAYGFTC